MTDVIFTLEEYNELAAALRKAKRHDLEKMLIKRWEESNGVKWNARFGEWWDEEKS